MKRFRMKTINPNADPFRRNDTISVKSRYLAEFGVARQPLGDILIPPS